MIDFDAVNSADRLAAMRAALRGQSQPQAPAPAPTEPVPTVTTVTERVTVTSVASASYLLKEDAAWTWEDLRDYVIGQIEEFHGPQLRNPTKEAAIFKGFLARHGAKAVGIARFAFEVNRGMWQRAPISVNRFCKGSDPYFADTIAARL